jgi:hypothetical protein
MIFVPWFQMYEDPTRFRLFGFDSRFSGSEDVDEVAIDGSRRGRDADVEVSGFAQQLASVLLTFFWGGIVCVWEACGLYVSYILQC